ncbi:hypothetical protein F443_17703 [Phytophthora nicotianae P1569]|uniref:Uncharacterized protein n=1 Tax=Phytophthora nicotianae P1569 TaxID=1317065 RepID=V9ECW8_PHYNI|nr:hypothetical protein F443_17703 [Phytophthora nicotianae P1569]
MAASSDGAAVYELSDAAASVLGAGLGLLRSTGAGTLSWLCSCKSTVVHKSIIRYLLERMVDSKLSRTSINDAAARLGCTRQTTSTVFRARNDDPPESARDTASA